MKTLHSITTLLVTFLLLFPTDSHAQDARKKGPGGPPRIASWQMPPVGGANLHYKTFESKAVGEKISYLIYLPEAYEQKKDARFPVVVWLHGIGGSQQGMPRLAEQFTMAIAQGKMPPVIVVFANGMIDSFYCDAINAARPVETVIIKELIPHIDTTYRTIAKREGRMIEGFSMGGYGAGHLGFKYPELFGSISMIDGALLDLATMQRRHAELFERIFAGKDETFTAAHPLTLVEKNAAQIKGRTFIRQAVGKIAEPNEALHQQMNRLGIAHDYDLFNDAGHNLGVIYERLGDKNWAFYAKAFAAPGVTAK